MTKNARRTGLSLFKYARASALVCLTAAAGMGGTPVLAQDGDRLSIEDIQAPNDEDRLIIEDVQAPKSTDMLGSLTKSLKESTFLTVGTFLTSIGDNKRNLYIADGGIDWQLSDNFQIYLDGRVWQQEIDVKQTRRSGGDDSNAPNERTVGITTDELELNEGYLAFSPTPELNIKIGRRKIVWGQFDVFSPVFFTMPFRTQNIGTDFSKVNFGLPQNNAQISFSPHERIEIQGYFFLNTILDPLLVESIQQDREGSETRSRSDLQDHNQYAARVMLYPDWGTIGLTYLNGRNSFTINRLETVGTNRDDFVESPGLSPLEAYSVEASIPSGRWNFKAEVSYIKTQGDVDRVVARPNVLDNTPANDTPREAYWRWAVEENGGRLYGDINTVFGGAGFKYQAPRWDFELAGYFLHQAYSGAAKRGAELVERYTDPPIETLQAAPFLNAAYYLTDDRKNLVALTAGFLGAYAVGGSLFVVGTFDQFDHLGLGTMQLVGGLDALQYRADEDVSDLNDQDMDDQGMNVQYQLDDALTFSPRVGIIWKF